MIAVITIDWIDFFMVIASSSYKRHRCRFNIYFFYYKHTYTHSHTLIIVRSYCVDELYVRIEFLFLFLLWSKKYSVHDICIRDTFKELQLCRVIVILLQRRSRGNWWECWFYGVKWRDCHEDKELLSYFWSIASIGLAGQTGGQSYIASVFLTHSSQTLPAAVICLNFARGYKSYDT